MTELNELEKQWEENKCVCVCHCIVDPSDHQLCASSLKRVLRRRKRRTSFRDELRAGVQFDHDVDSRSFQEKRRGTRKKRELFFAKRMKE